MKVANLLQGFLLLLVFFPQEFESREDCRRAAPSLLLKPAFQDEFEIIPPRKENRAGLSSVFCCAKSITLGCYSLCGRWNNTEVKENVLHKTGKSGAAACLDGSYCSFTIIFFCKVLNCRNLTFFFFCSVNWYFEFAYTATMVFTKKHKHLRNLGNQKVLRSGKRIEGLNSEDLFP